MAATPQIFDLIVAATEGQVAEFGATLEPASKSALLFTYLAELKQTRVGYAHRDGVLKVYGVAGDHPQYRKSYLAYMRLCASLSEKFSRNGGSRHDDDDQALTEALDDQEKMFYRARALFVRAQYREAHTTIRRLYKACRHTSADEIFVLRVAYLYYLCWLNMSHADPPPPELMQDMPDIVARALLAVAEIYRRLLSSVVAVDKRHYDLNTFFKDMDGLGSMPLLAPYSDVMDLFKVGLQWNYTTGTDKVEEREALLNRLTKLNQQVLRHKLWFPHNAVAVEDFLDSDLLYVGSRGIDTDDLDLARSAFTEMARRALSNNHGFYEGYAMKVIAIRFAQSDLDGIDVEIENLRRYSVQYNRELFIAFAGLFSARLELYQPRISEPRKLIDAILKMEEFFDQHPEALANTLRIKCKYFYRVNDIRGLYTTVQYLKSSRFQGVKTDHIRLFGDLLVSALEYNAAPSQKLKASLQRRITRLQKIAPGELFARGFMVKWVERFVTV